MDQNQNTPNTTNSEGSTESTTSTTSTPKTTKTTPEVDPDELLGPTENSSPSKGDPLKNEPDVELE